MPDGVTHDLIWKMGRLAVLPISIGVALITDSLPMARSCNVSLGVCVSGQTFMAIGVVAGYWYGRYITPDEDIVGMTVGEGYLMNHFPIIGNFIVAYWTLYGAMFRKHHRSFLTHGPFISTAIRYLFGFWWMVFLVKFGWWDTWATYMLIGAFIGTCVIDILHWAADKITKEIR